MLLPGLLALTTAAMFAGAAFYINFVEQPARLLLDDANLLKEWKPSYKAGFTMQASLAVVSAVFGAWAALSTLNWLWALGAVLVLSNWPYTLMVIMPTNHRLYAIKPEQADAATRALIVKWGGLHAVRTFLGSASVLAYLLAAS